MKAIAETYMRSWYDSSPGCNSMREDIELKFTCPHKDRPAPGTKLYACDSLEARAAAAQMAELATLRAQRDALVSALDGLLARADSGTRHGLDRSATHDGLQNCDAMAKARAALEGAK